MVTGSCPWEDGRHAGREGGPAYVVNLRCLPSDADESGWSAVRLLGRLVRTRPGEAAFVLLGAGSIAALLGLAIAGWLTR